MMFFMTLMFAGCGSESSETAAVISNDDIPYPQDVLFALDELNPETEASSLGLGKDSALHGREWMLASNAYAQAGIDLGYYEGFEPVLDTLRMVSLTAYSADEATFTGEYGDIPFKGVVDREADKSHYYVMVWGIRPGDTSYSRWVYADLLSETRGTLIINPYVMWTSTHSYPMTIKFVYNASSSGIKEVTGGAAGKWNDASEEDGSSYFYVKEDDTDPSNTIVTFQLYSKKVGGAVNESYGRFNRDTKFLHGREYDGSYTSGNVDPDSGMLYVNMTTFTAEGGTVPAMIDASGLAYPSVPDADYAEFPSTSIFPAEPTF